MKKNTAYLYEGLTPKNKNSMMLWESAGRAIYEANLTPQQITQLFQQIEQGATSAGGNRTGLGLTKDAAAKVSAAYNELKTKVANSGPVKGIDALYDQAAEKLKQATGGDQGVMQYVQKYRDFAKKHPVAQSLIYGALIAAAGISGAGAGGAAALGLFKMVDKLLQGEKFSSAAYSGAKTGAMAYAAGQIGKAVRGGDQAQQAAGALPANADWQDYEQALKGMNSNLYNEVVDTLNDMDTSEEWKTAFMKQVYTAAQQGVGKTTMSINNLIQTAAEQASMTVNADTASALAAAGNPTFESRNLSRKQVQAIFERVVKLNNRMLSEGRLQEGIWDDIKSGANKGLQGVKNLAGKAAGAVAQKAQTVGHNLTTKTTADKLQSAWKAAGSPTDSEAIEKILQSAGVNPDVVKSAFQSNNIPLSVAAGASTGSAGVDPTEPMPDVMTPGGNRSAQGGTDQGSTQDSATQSVGAEQPVTATPLPDVSKLTPEQKKQLIAQIDTLLKTMPKPKVPYSAIKQPTANQPTGGANGPITPQSDPSAFPKVINGKAIQFEEQEYLRFKFLVDGIKARI